MRQTVLTPIGLITQPSELGQYPAGALKTAINVAMRNPGMVEPFNSLVDLRLDASSNGFAFKKLWPSTSNLLTLSGAKASSTMTSLRWVSGSGSTLIQRNGTNTATTTGKAQAVRVRDRWIFTDTVNPWIIDTEGAATARWVGMAMPQHFVFASSATGNSQPTAMVGRWRCHFQRVQSDGYTTVGAVSNAYTVTNSSGVTKDNTFTVGWTSDYPLAVGDTIELYRTTWQDSGTDPGDDYFLAVSYKLTSTNISNHAATFADTIKEAGLGASLYTNSDQLGAAYTYLPPGRVEDASWFKGYTFYQEASVPSYAAVRVAGAFGGLAATTDRTHGIGTRDTTCNTTNGSPTITSVADTTGIVAGQTLVIAAAGFNAANPTTVVSIVGSTITASRNAVGSNTGAAMSTYDRIELDGTKVDASSLNDLLENIYNAGLNIVTVVGQPLPIITSATGTELEFMRPWAYYGNFTIRATNGANYTPALPEISATANTSSGDPRNNRVIWSQPDQPEACPSPNENFVGGGSIYRMIPTKDAVWFFCSDGLFRMSGEGGGTPAGTGGVWRWDPVDLTLHLYNRDCVDVLGDVVYAYTNRGLVAISDGAGVVFLSDQVIGDQIPGGEFLNSWDTFLSCNQLDREVWLFVRNTSNSTSPAYVYSAKTGAFTKCFAASGDDYVSAAVYWPFQSQLVFATGEGGTAPDVRTFNPNTVSTRMGGSEIVYQPIFGDDDPVTWKQWIDQTLVFNNVTATAVITPRFDSTNSVTRSLVVAGAGLESRVTVATPRNNSVATQLQYGFSFSSGATQAWKFLGFSARWIPASETSLR